MYDELIKQARELFADSNRDGFENDPMIVDAMCELADALEAAQKAGAVPMKGEETMSEWMTGYPETPGNYLVTTKSSGTVCMRHFNGFVWAFGEPLAWMWPPIPYKPSNESAQGGTSYDR